MASRRGLRENRPGEAPTVACRRPRRRSARELRHEAQRHTGSIEPQVREVKFLRQSFQRHARVETIVIDRLESYGAALKQIGAVAKREVGRLLTTGWRMSINHSGDGSGRCCASREAKTAEIRGSARLDQQPFQSGTHPHFSDHFQGTMHRRAGRLAATLHGLYNHGFGRNL
jgi:hypothetical protein